MASRAVNNIATQPLTPGITSSEFMIAIISTLAVAIDKIPAVGAVLSTQDVALILAIPMVYVVGRIFLKNKAMTVQSAVAEATADVAKALPAPATTDAPPAG